MEERICPCGKTFMPKKGIQKFCSRDCIYCKEQYKKRFKKYYLKPEVSKRKKEYSKKYMQKPEVKERRKILANKRYNENKEEFTKKRYKYFSNPKVRQNKNTYEKEKYWSDISFRIAQSLRRRTRKAIKNKYSSMDEYLGCKLKECLEHLESQFKEEMNWDNYGGYWEIDHIKPCASFDLSKREEQLKCFHYSNLQPLTITQNRKKFTKITKTF